MKLSRQPGRLHCVRNHCVPPRTVRALMHSAGVTLPVESLSERHLWQKTGWKKQTNQVYIVCCYSFFISLVMAFLLHLSVQSLVTIHFVHCCCLMKQIQIVSFMEFDLHKLLCQLFVKRLWILRMETWDWALRSENKRTKDWRWLEGKEKMFELTFYVLFNFGLLHFATVCNAV